MSLTYAQACDVYGVREWGARAPLAVRLLRGVVEDGNGCWLRGAVNKANGYSYIVAPWGRTCAHRAMYVVAFGPIADGLVIDHTCHTADDTCLGGPSCAHRRCVNPAHLEAVTSAENTKRGGRARWTHCAQGHELTPENTQVRTEGRRRCRTCSNAWYRNNRQGADVLALAKQAA